jgi:hypothetical protein
LSQCQLKLGGGSGPKKTTVIKELGLFEYYIILLTPTVIIISAHYDIVTFYLYLHCTYNVHAKYISEPEPPRIAERNIIRQGSTSTRNESLLHVKKPYIDAAVDQISPIVSSLGKDDIYVLQSYSSYRDERSIVTTKEIFPNK